MLCATTLSIVPHVALGGEGPYVGRRVVDVLQELQREGLDLVYSSAVVPADLEITVEPAGAGPRRILEEILAPLGLRAEEGPSGILQILTGGAQTATLSGSVRSRGQGIPVAGASIGIPGLELKGTTGRDGSFKIPGLPPGLYDLVVTAVGFATVELEGVRVGGKPGTALTVELEGRSPWTTEVIVTPGQHSVVRESQPAGHSLTQEEALLTPAVGGDLTRVLELLPGVSAADNTAAFNVRGSATGDVALVLDGLELYDPFHLQSFQSPFTLIDGNVVDRIDFFGGGFTADLGDRHGGFVNIETLAPLDPSAGQLEVGALNSRISYWAPTRSGAGSWLFSARFWYPEAVVHSTELGGGEKLNPHFGDVYAKVARTVSPRLRLQAHGLIAYDLLRFSETGESINETVDAVTRNGYVWLRALNAWRPGLSSETMLSGGRIERSRDGISSAGNPVVVSEDRVVEFVGLKHDSNWEISDRQLLKVGLDARWLRAEYRYSSVGLEPAPDEAGPPSLNPDGSSLGVYLTHRTRITPTLATEIGARWDRQDYTDDNQLSPRFNAMWRPGKRSEMRVALGSFNQSQRIHELHIADGESSFSRAETARSAELSLLHRFDSGLRLRVDLYDRRLSQLRPRYENRYEPIELFPETATDRVKIEPESARLRGVELLLRGSDERPFFWWIGYTRSSAEDTINGRVIPRSWDQPHAAKFLVGYRREDRWSLTLTGVVHTGWPTTAVTGQITTNTDGEIEEELVPLERNAIRFADYLRFDVKARRSVAIRRGELWLSLELLNLANRRNECCVDEFLFGAPRPDGSADVTRVIDGWRGFTPTFSVLWDF